MIHKNTLKTHNANWNSPSLSTSIPSSHPTASQTQAYTYLVNSVKELILYEWQKKMQNTGRNWLLHLTWQRLQCYVMYINRKKQSKVFLQDPWICKDEANDFGSIALVRRDRPVPLAQSKKKKTCRFMYLQLHKSHNNRYKRPQASVVARKKCKEKLENIALPSFPTREDISMSPTFLHKSCVTVQVKSLMLASVLHFTSPDTAAIWR